MNLDQGIGHSISHSISFRAGCVTRGVSIRGFNSIPWPLPFRYPRVARDGGRLQ